MGRVRTRIREIIRAKVMAKQVLVETRGKGLCLLSCRGCSGSKMEPIPRIAEGTIALTNVSDDEGS